MDPIFLKVSQIECWRQKLIAYFNLGKAVSKSSSASFLQPLHVCRGKPYFYSVLTELSNVLILFYRVYLYRIFMGLGKSITTIPQTTTHRY